VVFTDISYRESVVQTQRLVAQTRRWLDKFYGADPTTMTCVKCGSQSTGMRHLVFARRDRQSLSPDLIRFLWKFGVCSECLAPYQYKKHELLTVMNDHLRAHGLPQPH
jgi:hypothetical protein